MKETVSRACNKDDTVKYTIAHHPPPTHTHYLVLKVVFIARQNVYPKLLLIESVQCKNLAYQYMSLFAINKT